MSQHSAKHKPCPNCGSETTANFCAQCGQETHLHKDTFGALIMHFAGHYLHYDSKFWMTLRTLWFSPGMLTKAYWEEKRMRYIPPISLYIFVSFVFFFTYALLQEHRNRGGLIGLNDPKGRSMLNITIGDLSIGDAGDTTKNTGGTLFYLDYGKLKRKNPEIDKYVNEEAAHLIPKIFFLLIPLMAVVLKLLFLRRKDLLYVNHVIFSLHYHSFWFSLWTILILFPASLFASIPFLLVNAIYMVMAMRTAYEIKTFKSILYAGVIGISYIAFLLLVSFIMIFLIMVSAQMHG